MPRVIDRAGAEIYAACHAQGWIAFNLNALMNTDVRDFVEGCDKTSKTAALSGVSET